MEIATLQSCIQSKVQHIYCYIYNYINYIAQERCVAVPCSCLLEGFRLGIVGHDAGHCSPDVLGVLLNGAVTGELAALGYVANHHAQPAVLVLGGEREGGVSGGGERDEGGKREGGGGQEGGGRGVRGRERNNNSRPGVWGEYTLEGIL